MAGKARVHELAKELGVESKTVLAKLKEMGEFVKSASSTVEAPVARRLRSAFVAVRRAPAPAAPPAPAPTPASTPTPTPSPAPGGPRVSARPMPPRRPAAPAPGPKPKGPVPGPPQPAAPVAKPASAHDIEVAAAEARAAALKAEQEAAVKAAQAARQQQRDNPSAGSPRRTAATVPVPDRVRVPCRPVPVPRQRRPGTPAPGPGARPGGRPPARGAGNNPFGIQGGQQQRPPAAGAGGPRPNARPACRRGQPGLHAAAAQPGVHAEPASGYRSPRPRWRRSSRWRRAVVPVAVAVASVAVPAVAPVAVAAAVTAAARRRCRRWRWLPWRSRWRRRCSRWRFPSGCSGRWRRSSRWRRSWPWRRRRGCLRASGWPADARSQVQEAAQTGVRQPVGPDHELGAPRGQGQVVRLSRGASLSDFADKINANPGSLVQEMFNLGEMVTATQSCSDETLQLLGEHLGFDVQIVSPEDEDRELLAQFNIDLDAEVARGAPGQPCAGGDRHGSRRPR